MKVIDLLNKMALDENYKPNKVIHKGIIYEYKAPCYYYRVEYIELVGLFSNYQVERVLNDEIEIIEATEEDIIRMFENPLTEESKKFEKKYKRGVKGE